SIKHIIVQAKQSNLSIPHDYNGREIQLSKNHGFLSVFEWYAFPYFYVDNNILPIDTSMHNRIPRAVTEKDYSKIDFTTMYQPGTYWQVHDSLVHPHNLFDAWIQDSILSMSLLTPTSAEVHFKRIEAVHIYKMIQAPSQTYPGGLYLDSVYTRQYLYTDTISDPYVTVNRSIRKAKIPELYESIINPVPFDYLARVYRLFFNSYTNQMRTIYDSDNWWDWTITTTQFTACYQIHNGTSGNKVYSLGYLPQLNYVPGYYFVLTGSSYTENDDHFTLIFYKDQLQKYGNPVDVSTLSTSQLQQANSISVYPNPSLNGIFQIGLTENSTWSVFGLDGKHIKSGLQQVVNLSEQKQGIYLLKIQTPKTSYYSKLIIQ
ncbi:MAG TPA: T9SS type A sorting domain-containing protein, partial [Chitinophagaceae bacterium]|nr:T9SS type A sorting domain-containing protein [Chitinophagaceae bacterium]